MELLIALQSACPYEGRADVVHGRTIAGSWSTQHCGGARDDADHGVAGRSTCRRSPALLAAVLHHGTRAAPSAESRAPRTAAPLPCRPTARREPHAAAPRAAPPPQPSAPPPSAPPCRRRLGGRPAATAAAQRAASCCPPHHRPTRPERRAPQRCLAWFFAPTRGRTARACVSFRMDEEKNKEIRGNLVFLPWCLGILIFFYFIYSECI